MAIEMVYIPQESFYVGSGGTESGSFTNGSWTSGATIPLQITSEDALTIGQSAGNLWGTSSSGNNTIGAAGTLPAAFPKGYGDFYIMKYDASQGQWVDFFNTLTADQKTTRDITGGTGKNSDSEVNRNTISWTSGDASAGANQYVGCNFLSWADLTAYADWAGLRPFTELEYEKAARGTATAVANEYAWGSIAIASSAYTLADPGTATESIATNYQTALGNCLYTTTKFTPNGPARCGIFATSSSTRIQAGASYYGVMELSGNLWKRPVTIGDATGRGFTGGHGDGTLDASGNANVTNWPGTAATGSGFRGGVWYYGATWARVSDRGFAAYSNAGRGSGNGGRLARTSP